ncbi:MAG: methylated-DNA--[protein]-cysteine S-methyltransferase [Alphaproteobacteria bacterium]|nr:methylated-DNA--[protein]-cysteine S-methyltransferase [Alphaproteobacteria bacterium]
MSKQYWGVIETPIGPLAAAIDGAGRLTHLGVSKRERDWIAANGGDRDDRALAPVARQLAEYFAGRRRSFDLPLAAEGTPFQRRVWAALMKIPYGKTTTYAALAEKLGRPGAFRAVGRANATNPIALIVPCHRVIGSDGTLTGYAGGIPIKQKLLELEGALS